MSKKRQPHKPSKKAALKKAASKNGSASEKGSALQRINPVWLMIGLVIVTLIAYAGAFTNGFVEWDDQHYVTDNLMVLDPTLENIKLLLTRIVALNYHPITMLSLAMNVLFFGKGAASFIITNVVIHIANTLLVFILIQKLTDKKLAVSFFTALLFAIHPMHVESVAWIAERKDVLYAFFFLASCIFYIKYRENKQVKWLLICLLMFILSCLSKAMGVVLPVVLILIDYWQGRTWFSVKSLSEKIPFLLIALLFGLISVNVQAGGDFYGLLSRNLKNAALTTTVFSGLERVAYPMYGYLQYHIMAILPFGLSNLHPYPAVSEANEAKYIFAIAFFVLSLVVMLWSYNKQKFIFFGWGFFLVTIILVLQFLSVGKAFMAERYSYLPYIGLFFMIFYGLNKWLKPWITWLIGAIFGVFFTILTMQQVKVWKDNFSLWSNAYKQYPNDGSILDSMADEYGRRGEFDKVEMFAQKSIATGIKSYHTFEIMANIYALKGDLNKSLEMYTNAMAIDSSVGNIYYNRGITYLNAKRYEEAARDFTRSMTLESNEKPFKVRSARGVAYIQLKRYDEALEDLNFAIQQSDIPNAGHFLDRAVVRFNLKDTTGAVEDLQKTLQLDPANQRAAENLKLLENLK